MLHWVVGHTTVVPRRILASPPDELAAYLPPPAHGATEAVEGSVQAYSHVHTLMSSCEGHHQASTERVLWNPGWV